MCDEKKQVCPVCGGSGLVPGGFYDIQPSSTYSGTAIPMREPCRACGGKGIV